MAVRSPVAMAEVVVREGVFTDEGMILGKVSAECVVCGAPGLPGDPDLGIPGVRVYLQDGTSAVTDAEGKYSFHGLRPRSWVVRLDPSTVPPARFARITNRHSDDGLTLFVDVFRGELARGDFRAQMDSTAAAQWTETQERRIDPAPAGRSGSVRRGRHSDRLLQPASSSGSTPPTWATLPCSKIRTRRCCRLLTPSKLWSDQKLEDR